MPKRRPVFELRDLSGFRGSPAPERRRRHSSSLTDESPRPPSLTISSRHRSFPSYRSRPRRTHNNRRKRRKRHHSRSAHYSSTARHRRTRSSRAPAHHRSPPRRRGHYQEDQPPDSYLSPDDDDNPDHRSPQPSRYPENHHEDEEGGSDDDSGFQQMVYGESSPRASEVHQRAGRHHARHRRRHHRGKTRRRRRRHRDKENSSNNHNQAHSENRDDGTEGHASDSDSVEYDEDGNPIQPSDQQGLLGKLGKMLGQGTEEDGKDKKGKKRNIAKAAALVVSALVVGLVAKKIITKRRKKKADAEAEIAAAQQEAELEAAGPYGSSGGQLFMGPNPLQLEVPETSLSVKVPESEAFIVERGGKYNRRLNPGSNTLVPFVDRIAFRFSLKEVSIPVPPQQCYTRENISAIVSALLLVKVEDAVAAAYGVDDARRSLMLVTQICMRKEIAKLGLEQMLLERDGLGERILANINRASRPWGVRCIRFEVRDFEIPEEIREAFARQAQIERQVRADVLVSQGANEAMKHRADGELHAQMRMSQAQGIHVVNKATAEAQAISERGQAIAGALRDVAEVANEPGGTRAMHMRIAEQYIHAYMKASEGREDLPPVPTANDVADALDKGLGFLDALGEPGSQLVDPSAASVGGAKLPPAIPAVEHEGGSGHGITVRPTSAASMSGSPHPKFSQQMRPTNSRSSHGTPQVQKGVSPLVGGTQPSPQGCSRNSEPSVVGGTEGSNYSRSKQRIKRQAAANQKPSGHYSGPIYPQA